MGSKSCGSLLSSVILLIVVFILGYLEAGVTGGLVAVGIALLADLSALLGLIPVIGVFIHYNFTYPAIVGLFTTLAPAVSIPITGTIILIVTTLLAVVYTIIALVVVIAVSTK